MKTKSLLTVALVSFLSFVPISLTWGAVQTITVNPGLNDVMLTVQPADNRLNGGTGCVGQELAAGLEKGPAPAEADMIYKGSESAFLADAPGTPFDEKWFDPNAEALSTMTIDACEHFWILNRASHAKTVEISGTTACCANAGPDQTVNEGVVVTLDGSASTAATSFLWEQVFGPSVVINNANQEMASFTAPGVAWQDQVTFRLTASNAQASASDEVTFTVMDVDSYHIYRYSADFDGRTGTGQLVFADGQWVQGYVEHDLTEYMVGRPANRAPTEDALAGNDYYFQNQDYSQSYRDASVNPMHIEFRDFGNAADEPFIGHTTQGDWLNYTFSSTKTVVTSFPVEGVLYVTALAASDVGVLEFIELELQSGVDTAKGTIGFIGEGLDEFRWRPAASAFAVKSGQATIRFRVAKGNWDFCKFRLDLGPECCIADAGPDETAYSGDTVTLDGSASIGAITSWLWEQTAGPAVAITNANQPIATFTAPSVAGAETLTFKVSVGDGTTTSSDTVNVTVLDAAPPAPVTGLTAEGVELGIALTWNPADGADSYKILRREVGVPFPFDTLVAEDLTGTSFTDTSTPFYMDQVYSYTVIAVNTFGEGSPSVPAQAYALSANLALRPDTGPFAKKPHPGWTLGTVMNNGDREESFDSWFNDEASADDWWGYNWSVPLYFQEIHYYPGNVFGHGGYWTSLGVQFTKDGVDWYNIPSVTITPAYQFSPDTPDGRSPALGQLPFIRRHMLKFPRVEGIGLRIYGAPGGAADFTSVAEIEVFGVPGAEEYLYAYAGADFIADEGSVATLNGADSSSPLAVKYLWEQVTGAGGEVTKVDLSSAANADVIWAKGEVLADQDAFEPGGANYLFTSNPDVGPYALPADGVICFSPHYQLAPYTNNNCLLLSEQQPSGVVPVPPGNYGYVAVLFAGAGGNHWTNLTLNYADGDGSAVPFEFSDWFFRADVERCVEETYRVSRKDGSTDRNDATPVGGPNLYHRVLPVDETRTLLSVTFSGFAGSGAQTAGVFAINLGPPVPVLELSDPNAAVCTFPVPDITSDQLITLRLTVWDALNNSSTDEVHVRLSACSAYAGPDQTIFCNRGTTVTVTLNGSASRNAIAYKWEKVLGPGVTIVGADSLIATFEVPCSIAPAVLTFKLTVVCEPCSAVDFVTVTIDPFYEKEPYHDYAQWGVPDFSQKQKEWGKRGASGWKWTWDGPVAVANSLWWMDSRFEAEYYKPPKEFGCFPLVQPYGEWDDHHADNVTPFVKDLAEHMKTDGGVADPCKWDGTRVEDMVKGIRAYIALKGLQPGNPTYDFGFEVALTKDPDFIEHIAPELRRCQDVILLLGFYVWKEKEEKYSRIGGHFVTVAGLREAETLIKISDPYLDTPAGDNGPSAPVNFPLIPHGDLLVPGSHAPVQHNDADFVSHDRYLVGLLQDRENYLVDYPWSDSGDALLLSELEDNFANANAPLGGVAPPHDHAGDYLTKIEYMVHISPTYWYCKERYHDYAQWGVPDFCQKQDGWGKVPGLDPGDASNNPYNPDWRWTWDGPVAVANSLWWMDSRFEELYAPAGELFKPTRDSDHFWLVTTYWGINDDDHHPANVAPLVEDLARRMGTDGGVTPCLWEGTRIDDMEAGIQQYIQVQTGLPPGLWCWDWLRVNFSVTLVKDPDLAKDIAPELCRCQDVILLLGFYERKDTYYYERVGGHFVTAVGVNKRDRLIKISDPFFDTPAGDNGPSGPGRFKIPHNHTLPGESTQHNDADFISHDKYTVGVLPDGENFLEDYPWSDSGVSWMRAALEANFARVNEPRPGTIAREILVNNKYLTKIEYMVDISPFYYEYPIPVNANPGPNPFVLPVRAPHIALNGGHGCIGEQLAACLTGGTDPSTADVIIKGSQTAFLVDGWGPPYDGMWWDAVTDAPSEMTIDAYELFQIVNRASCAKTIKVWGTAVSCANAGADMTVDEFAAVTLDGSATTSFATTFLWEQVSGPSVVINNPTQRDASFTAPGVLMRESVTFRLSASDSLWSGSDEVTFTVMDVNTYHVYRYTADFDGRTATGDLVRAGSHPTDEAERQKWVTGYAEHDKKQYMPGVLANKALTADAIADNDFFFLDTSHSQLYRDPSLPFYVNFLGAGEVDPFIGYTTVGDWWHYSFNSSRTETTAFPADGVMAITALAATDAGDTVVEVYLDEVLKTTINFTGKNLADFQWRPGAGTFLVARGAHTIRLRLAQGSWDFCNFRLDLAVPGIDGVPPIKRDGDSLSLSWQPFGTGEYTVEWTNDLYRGAWETPPGDWPITDPAWTDENVLGGGANKRFYRVRGE